MVHLNHKRKLLGVNLMILKLLTDESASFSEWIATRGSHLWKWFGISFPANICLFKANNRSTRKRYEICSKLRIKTSKRGHLRRSGVFIVNFEHISNLFLVFEQVNVSLKTVFFLFFFVFLPF